ncbi:MAG TPA: acyl-CoA synthetase [Pseudonocardiaceae bacterium]|jgi:fatty acid CoA ligase FadD36|nr:acyl-CoA synthetase [Pseudonocardiaceae bacterium]
MPLLTALSGDLGADSADALRVAGVDCSREALLGKASAVADRIAGLPAVAVLAKPTLHTVVAVVGGLLAGVPVVPLPPDSGTLERQHILHDSGAAVLLTAQPLDEAGVEVLPVDLDQHSATSRPEPDDSATALILYTSGTTGKPKGALISRRAIAASLDGLAEAWAWTPDDTLAHGLPLFHVHGLVLGVLGALRTGSKLVHTGSAKPEAYAAAGASMYFGVPTVWSRVCQDPASARALSAARLLVSGSAPLPAPVFARLAELTGQSPVERYGMTETLITVSTRAEGDRRPGYVGLPLRGMETTLVGEDGAAVPQDGNAIGELRIRGASLFDGYLNRPEATAASWAEGGWFRTGDVATIDADGWHRIVGRASTDLIKSGGYRIGAGEVENVLLGHPAVREAAVVGLPDPDLGQRVVAYVVAGEVAERELIEFVSGQLSHHKRPRQIRFVDALPRNEMGKVQKRLLAET